MKYYNVEQNNMKKSVVYFVVLIFGFIIMLIFILLTMYYLTPNNYELIKWDENKFHHCNKIEYIIKSNTIINIGCIESDKYLMFPSQTNLIVSNIIKSQNISINEDNELVKSKYNSEIFLTNNSDIDKKITINFYSLNR